MIVENFVVGELRKQTGWSKREANLFHFRTQTDTEVDIVMKTSDGEVVGIEIKARASVGVDAFKGLRILENELGKKFKRGIVLYAGEKTFRSAKRCLPCLYNLCGCYKFHHSERANRLKQSL